jgi:hypothetical protein
LQVKVIGKGAVELHWQPDEPQYHPDLVRQAEEKWQTRPPQVFNGSLFVHQRTEVTADKTTLHGAFTGYKYYYAQKQGIPFGIEPIGVSGFIVADNHLVIARRSPHVTAYPNKLELVPAGTIDRSVAQDDGTVDFIQKMREEFHEEVGLPLDVIQSVQPIGVFYDIEDGIYDVVCRLEVQAAAQDILTSLQRSDEYDAPLLLPVSDVRHWMQVHQSDLLPTSTAILESFHVE